MSTVVFNYIWRFSVTDFPLSSSNLQGHQSTLSCLLISLSGVRLINFIFLAAALYVGVYVRISLLCHCYHRFACRWCRSWSLSTFNSVFSFLHQISCTYDILSWRFVFRTGTWCPMFDCFLFLISNGARSPLWGTWLCTSTSKQIRKWPQNNIHALLPFLTNSDAVCILHHFSRIELFGNVTGAHGDSSEIAEYLLLSC